MVILIEHVYKKVLTADVVSKDSGTISVDLGDQGGISALFLRLSATNGAGGSATYGIRAAISEIRVKTGKGDVPFRLSANDAYALATLRDGIAPELSEGTGGGAVQAVRIPVCFGINREDTDHGLDLVNCAGATLEIDYAITVSGADGFVTKSLTLDVDALETRGKVKPVYKGCLRTAIAGLHTTAVKDPHVVELKGSRNLIGLHAYAYLSGTADNALVSNIRLIRAGENEPMIDAGFSDLQYRHPTLAGSIVTSYATVWKAPGRDGNRSLIAEIAPELRVELKELVAAGAARLIGEWIGAA